MKRLALKSLVVLTALTFASGAFAYTSPGNATGYINDYAQVLLPDTKTDLEQLLSEYEASTTNEIAVAIIPNMGGDYIENFAEKLFREWHIGKADKDNGVLLLISINERRVRIEVGYGLEGRLPDSVAQRIINKDIVPRLKENNYDSAVRAGAESILAATKGEYTGGDSTSKLSFEDWWVAFFIGFFVLQWFVAILARSKSWWAGGVFGFFGALGIGGFFGLSALIFLIVTTVLTLFGLALDYVVSNAYRVAKSAGKSVPYWAGGGPHSSGGGFGGFGGGSSGGGGASGSW